VDEGAANGHALLLALAQLARESIGAVQDIHPLQDGRDGLSHVLSPLAGGAQRIAHVLPNVFVGQKAEVLGHDAHLTAQMGHFLGSHRAQIPPGKHGGARCVRDLAADHLEQGAFS
jgi:hypothetical protein